MPKGFRVFGGRSNSIGQTKMGPYPAILIILSYILWRSPSIRKSIHDQVTKQGKNILFFVCAILILILIVNGMMEGFDIGDKEVASCKNSEDPCCNEPSKELLCSNINVGSQVSNELWDNECGSINPCP